MTFYAVTVSLASKDQYSASVNVLRLANGDRCLCNDHLRTIISSPKDYQSLHDDFQSSAFVRTSISEIFSTIVHASIKWKQERFVLTIEHLTALVPFVPAYVLTFKFETVDLAWFVVAPLLVATSISTFSERSLYMKLEEKGLDVRKVSLGTSLILITFFITQTSPLMWQLRHIFLRYIEEYGRYSYQDVILPTVAMIIMPAALYQLYALLLPWMTSSRN